MPFLPEVDQFWIVCDRTRLFYLVLCALISDFSKGATLYLLVFSFCSWKVEQKGKKALKSKKGRKFKQNNNSEPESLGKTDIKKRLWHLKF